LPLRPDRSIPATDAERRVRAGHVHVPFVFKNGENIEGIQVYTAWAEDANLSKMYHDDVMELITYQLVANTNK
jgi:hypothetical protein